MMNPQTITVVRGGTNKYGDPTTPTEPIIAGCIVAPAATSSAGGVTGWSTTQYSLYPPAGADIRAGDQIRLADGSLWKVDGDPFCWSNPLSGSTPGGEVQLTRIH